MNIIKPTGVPTKNPGDSIKSSEINSLNNTINTVVNLGNIGLREFCNINLEITGNYNPLEFEKAIELIPETRRVKGLIVRFLTETSWETWCFTGNTWGDQESWEAIGDSDIDGGEF